MSCVTLRGQFVVAQIILMRTHPPLGPVRQSFALGLRALLLVLVACTAPAAAAQPAATPALRVVVLEGEDAVNIIQ